MEGAMRTRAPRFDRWNVIAPTRYADNFAASVVSEIKTPAQTSAAGTPPQLRQAIPTAGPLRHAVLSSNIWDHLRGACLWRELDKARSAALQRALTDLSRDSSWYLTGILSGRPSASSHGRMHISALSAPTDDVESTLKTALRSASDSTIVGWYILNVGVGVQPLPSTLVNICSVLTQIPQSLPANRPGALFHIVVVDCVKSQTSTDAHLECFDASGALACDGSGSWRMNMSKLTPVDWSVEEFE